MDMSIGTVESAAETVFLQSLFCCECDRTGCYKPGPRARTMTCVKDIDTLFHSFYRVLKRVLFDGTAAI